MRMNEAEQYMDKETVVPSGKIMKRQRGSSDESLRKMAFGCSPTEATYDRRFSTRPAAPWLAARSPM